MNGDDFKRLEQIIVNSKEDVKTEFRQIVVDFKEEVKAEFRHQIGIQSEHFQHKLDIVIEGHEVLRKEIRDTREELCEKIEFVDFKVEAINQKLDAVAADLSRVSLISLQSTSWPSTTMSSLCWKCSDWIPI
jgi:hypothetical protein